MAAASPSSYRNLDWLGGFVPTRMLRVRKRLVSIGLATAILLAGVAPAGAAVTIGSSLATPATINTNCNGTPCTTANVTLLAANQAPGGLTSPVNGTVTSWRASAGGTATDISLRILRPNGGLTYTGAGTSAATSITGVSAPIGTSLPIRAGDSIGLNVGNSGLVLGSNAGATQVWWTLPPLADGSTRAGSAGNAIETLVQAVVEPSNTLTLGKPRLNKKNGTAKMIVTVPNPGQLSFSGKGVKVTGPSGAVTTGAITVKVKAKGKKARKLRETGKVAVKPSFTFTPTNGTTATQAKKLKLKRST